MQYSFYLERDTNNAFEAITQNNTGTLVTIFFFDYLVKQYSFYLERDAP